MDHAESEAHRRHAGQSAGQHRQQAQHHRPGRTVDQQQEADDDQAAEAGEA